MIMHPSPASETPTVSPASETPYVNSYFRQLHSVLRSAGLQESEHNNEGSSRKDRRRNFARDMKEYPREVRRAYAQCAKSVRAARRAETQGDLDTAQSHLRQFRNSFHALLDALGNSGNQESEQNR